MKSTEKSVAAKMKEAHALVDQGYVFVVPKKYRWHESQKNFDAYKIDTSSVNMRDLSLEQLKRPANSVKNMDFLKKV